MKTNELKRQIDVTKEVREKIAKVFNCNRISVWRALSFNDDSATSKRIREYAIQNGGVIMVLAPETETIHDCNGFMRQYFANGAMLEIDKNNGMLHVYANNGILRNEVKEGCTIQQLYVMQEFAQSL